MALDVTVPYDTTPYDTLNHPKLGPLSVNATLRQVQERFTQLTRLTPPTPAIRDAWTTLRTPAKRVGVDIFCSTLEHEQQALQDLVSKRPVFKRPAADGTVARLGPELLVLDAGLGETRPIARRTVELTLSHTYAEPPAALGAPPMDL